MNKKVLVIGVGAFQMMGLKFLREQNYLIVGIDGNPDAAGKVYCDHFYNIQLNKNDEILALAREEQVEFAIGFECDPAVEAINFVNRHLGKTSLNELASKASLDKSLVRTIQKKLNINCPEFYEISSLEILIQLVQGSNKKWVLKPKASSGSRGVQLLDETSDLKTIYEGSSQYKREENEVLLLEEFISGREIAIDGFSHQGVCHLLTISYKDRTDPPYLLDTGLLITSNVDNIIAKEARNQLQAIFSHLQAGLTSPYHAEFIVHGSSVYLVEFSFRGAGFNVFSKWIPLVTEFNTLKFSLDQNDSQRSWQYEPSKIKKSIYLGFLDGLDGILKEIVFPPTIQNDPDLFESKVYVFPGEKTKSLKSGADRLGHLVLLGTNETDLKDKFVKWKSEIKFIYE